MISIKPGAKIEGIKAEILLGLQVVNSVFERYGIGLVITEGTGGRHMQGSLHYQGLAIDIRSKNIPDTATRTSILIECIEHLGKDFDMILECADTDNEHLHIEFDPK